MSKSNPPIGLRSVLPAKAELVVHAADLTVTARALAKLMAEKSDNLFVHNGRPALVIVDDDGAPIIRPAGCDEIIIAAHKHCQPVKPKSPSERGEVTLPDKVAELYLAMPDEWRLRPLRGITTAPILHDDGSIRWEPGYDAATGMFCACNLPALSLPDKPSREDAVSALATLRRTFRTIAFADRKIVIEKMNADGETIDVEVVDLNQDPGRDESGFLVALLTAIARASLPLAPGAVVRGPPHSGSGVGKGLLVHAKSIIAHGRRAKAAALGEKREEFDKGLTAALLRGEPFVFIDNLNNVTLRSRLLCAVLGERDADLRRLGAGMESASPAFISITGNALAIAEDLVRRVITIELDARCENPERRKFAGDFLTDIESRRAELLQAALVIWRWGRQAKLKTKGSTPLGGFERWTESLCDPLVALGCQDPVTKIAKLKTSDPVRLDTVEIFRTWWLLHGNKAVTAKDLSNDVKALLVPKAKEPSRQAVASRVAKLDGTRLAGFHLTSNKDDENKGYWTPVHYRLEASKSAQTADATSVDVITEADIREYMSKPAARPADAGGMPFVITEATKEQLRVQGRSHEEIANLTPQKAREILLAALATVLAEWGKTIGVGATRSLDHVIKIAADHPSLKAALVVVAPMDGAETISNVRLARWLRDYNEVPINGLQLSGGGVDETGSPLWTLQSLPSKPLHGKDLPLGDEAPASEPEPEPEATGGSSEEDDADGWQFNREPDAVRPEPAAPEAPPDAFNAEGRLAVWRNAFAPLNFETEPCPGWRPGEWPRAYACCKQFLAGSWALAAARAGWSALDLFAVHKTVGVAARDCVGALTGNTTNGFAVRVEADELQFTNGRKVQKRPLDSDVCVPIWSFRAPTTTTSVPAPQEPAR